MLPCETRHAEEAGELDLQGGETLLLPACDVVLRLRFSELRENHPRRVRVVEERRAALIHQMTMVLTNSEREGGKCARCHEGLAVKQNKGGKKEAVGGCFHWGNRGSCMGGLSGQTKSLKGF